MRALFATMMLMARQAQAANTDYTDNGDNWASTAKCGGNTQGPIKLSTTLTATKEESNYFHYENVKGDILGMLKLKPTDTAQGTVYWSDKSSAVYLILDNTGLLGVGAGVTDAQLKGQLPTKIPTKDRKFHNAPNWFKTSIATKTEYGGAKVYYAKQLHFHWKSEHTIDDVQTDLEMHIVHQGPDQVPTASEDEYPLGMLGVIGVMFDSDPKKAANVSKATVDAIDNFFDNLMYEKIDDAGKKIIADEIALGQLMAVLNLNDRFVYTGSLTTPPCYQKVFFNVLSTIYPIKKYHLDYYINVVKKRADPATKSAEKGNFRNVRAATTDHKLIYVKGAAPVDTTPESETSAAAAAALALTIIFVIVVLIAMALTVYNCVLWEEVKKLEEGGAGGASAQELAGAVKTNEA